MRSLSIRPVYLAALLAFAAGTLATTLWFKRRPSLPASGRELLAAAPPASRFGWFHDFNVQLLQAYPQRGDVVLLGDSITQYGAWHRLLPDVAIVNQGIAGDTIDGLIDRIGSAYTSGARTAVVTIGTNNIVTGKLKADSFFAKWAGLIEDLRAHGLAVVVVSIPATLSPIINAQIHAMNARLKAHCEARPCRYVDLNATLAPSGRIEGRSTLDGVHFTVAAYQAWAELLAPGLPSH